MIQVVNNLKIIISELECSFIFIDEHLGNYPMIVFPCRLLWRTMQQQSSQNHVLGSLLICSRDQKQSFLLNLIPKQLGQLVHPFLSTNDSYGFRQSYRFQSSVQSNRDDVVRHVQLMLCRPSGQLLLYDFHNIQQVD